MKRGKYITALILFAAATVLLALFNLDGFPQALPNTYKLVVSNPAKVDYIGLDQIARQHNLLFCGITQQNTGLQKRTVTFYTGADQQDALWQEHLGLEPGIVKDVLGNECTIAGDTLEALMQNQEERNSVQFCYLLGDPADCDAAEEELYKQCGSAIQAEKPHVGEKPKLITGVFLLIYLVLLFYFYLDASFEKKEIAIRVLHGDSAVYHYLRFCLRDTLCFSALFAGCCLLQDAYTQTLRFYTHIRWLFVPFLLGVWLVNLHLLRIKPKEMLYGHQLSGRLLAMLNLLGNAAALLSCLVILSMVSALPTISKYQKAEDFFRTRQNYAFLSVQPLAATMDDPENDGFQRGLREMRRFFSEREEQLAPVCIQDISGELAGLEREDLNIHLVYCNHRALSYVQSVYPEAEQADLTRYEAVLLLPASFTQEEAELAELLLLEYNERAEGEMPAESRIRRIPYISEEELLCFREFANSRFTFYENPAVLIAADSLQHESPEQLRHDYLESGSIYQVPDTQHMQGLTEGYALKASATNVYEKFQIEYQVQKSLIAVFLLVTVLMILLYVSVLRTILQLDYQVNATELAIRKTLGESIWQKNRRYFVTALVIGGINLLAAGIYVYQTEMQYPLLVLGVPLVLTVINMGLIYRLIRKVEAQQIARILKGGAL